MNRTSLAIAVMTAAGFMSAAASITTAQAGNDRSPTASARSSSQGARAVSRNLALVRTKVSSDNSLVAVASGFQAIDAGTVLFCPATATNCVIVAQQNVQIRSATANNNWAICTQVNGAFLTNPSCPFLGPPPFTGTFTANSFAQSSGALAPGVNHTVRTFLFTNNGADRSIYEITYSIYR